MPRRINPALPGIAKPHLPLHAASQGTTATSGYDHNPPDGVACTHQLYRTCYRTDSWTQSFSSKSASCPAAFLRMQLPQPTGNNPRSRASNSGGLLPRHLRPAPSACSSYSLPQPTSTVSALSMAWPPQSTQRRAVALLSGFIILTAAKAQPWSQRQTGALSILTTSGPRHHCSLHANY